MLYNNVTVDDELKYFETSMGKKVGTESRTQVLLGYDILQCQHITTTYTTGQKLYPYVK